MCHCGAVVRLFGSISFEFEPIGFDPRSEHPLFSLISDSFQMNESSFTLKENLKSETVGTIRSLPTLISKREWFWYELPLNLFIKPSDVEKKYKRLKKNNDFSLYETASRELEDLRVVHTRTILFLKSMSEAIGSFRLSPTSNSL